MAVSDLGATGFTFRGDRTSITYFPTFTPGPESQGQEDGKLEYYGPEGNHTFLDGDITRLESALGTLVTVEVRPGQGPKLPGTSLTVLVPKAVGVTREQPVTFVTVAVKATGRGAVLGSGVELTYDILPLVGEAMDVPVPV